MLTLLSLSFTNISTYTTDITILGKEDKRFILIGSAHMNMKETPSQAAFFEKFIELLNTHNPQKTKFYYELDHETDSARKEYIIKKGKTKLQFWNPFKALTTHIDQEMQELYDAFTKWDGAALARLRFYDPDIKFTTKSFDIRSIDHQQDNKKVFKALKESILLSLADYPEKEKLFEEALRGKKIQVHAGDLQLMEQIKTEFKQYDLFIVHAGYHHTNLMSELLQIEGWAILEKIKSTNPDEWQSLIDTVTEEPLEVVEQAAPEDWDFMDAGDAFSPRAPLD